MKKFYFLIFISIVLIGVQNIEPLQGQEAFNYDSKRKRDPFLPLVTETGQIIDLEPKETASSLYLEGIIFDKKGESFAIINGDVFRKDEAISDYLIFDIKPREVILIRGNERIVLELDKESK